MKKMLIAAVSAIAVIASVVGCQIYDQNSNETIYTAMNRDSAISWEEYAKPINEQYKSCANAITYVTIDALTVVLTDVSKDVTFDAYKDETNKYIVDPATIDIKSDVYKVYAIRSTNVQVDDKLLDYISDTTVDRIKEIKKDTTVDTAVDLIKSVTVTSNIDSTIESLLKEFLEFDQFFTVARKKVAAKDASIDFYNVDAVKNAYMTNAEINAKEYMKAQIAYAKAKYLKDKGNKNDDATEKAIKEKKLSDYMSRVKMEGFSLKDLWDEECKLKWDWNSVK